MKKDLEGLWIIFSLIIFPTAFIIAPMTSHLGLMEILNFTDCFISDHTWGWIGTILFIPVGIAVYLMPNDIGYLVTGFQLIFMQAGVFVIYLFFATTYPPKFLVGEAEEQEDMQQPH